MKVLLIGGGAREAALAAAICNSGAELYSLMHNTNPEIIQLSKDWAKNDETDLESVKNWALKKEIDFAIIGIEDPLSIGIVDELEKVGIPSVGPSKKAARIESSKLFARNLLKEHNIPGQILFQCFDDPRKLEKFILTSNQEFVIKPLGLTAGKGVKIMGEHLISKKEAIEYGQEVIEQGLGGFNKVIVEEKLIGEEFTLQCFVDGKVVKPMPPVQDHKRAFEGDTGPNTGGMGSYSQEDGLLPFLTMQEYQQGVQIMQKVVNAMRVEGLPYKGILYGQFMITRNGLKIIEFNARFGDPEAMNVLCLLKTNFIDICKAIIAGTLDSQPVEFFKKATVCKYIVPVGYGTNPLIGSILHVDRKSIEARGGKVFYAKVDEKDGNVITTNSRAIGLVATADSIAEAELIVESCLEFVSGDYHVRHDIGKKELIDKKINRMENVRHFHALKV